MTFGERLKAAREARGMSIGEAAGLLGVTQGTVSKYEHGVLCNPRYEFILRASKVFGVSLNTLMGWDCGNPDADIAILCRGGGAARLNSRAARCLRELLGE